MLVEFIKGSAETQEVNKNFLALVQEQSNNITRMLEIAKESSGFKETVSGVVADYVFSEEYQKLAYRNNYIQLELNKINIDGKVIPNLQTVLEAEDSRIKSMEEELEQLENPKEEVKESE